MINLILLGPPGAGKGTQAQKLAEYFNVTKLSTGDMLRFSVANRTKIGLQVKSIMEDGRLVPDDIMINMIADRIAGDDCKNGFILDGFPRTLSQAIALNEMLDKESLKINKVIELRVDDSVLIERISGRYSCHDCNENYNSKFKPTKVQGVCDTCGGKKFIYREDDKAETVKARLEAYHNLTAPLLPYYRERGELAVVDGVKEIDVVTQQIDRLLRPDS